MCAIDATTSSARTSCGHTFHFGCLGTWANRNANCPLCRGPLGETDTVQQLTPEPRFDMRLFDGADRIFPRPGWTRESLSLPFHHPQRVRRLLGTDVPASVYDFLDSDRPVWRRTLNDRLREMYAARSLEEHTHEVPDPIDVRFVAEYGCLPLETARAYLAFHGNDPIETALYLLRRTEDRPIPHFKPRDRPASEELYVSRDITARTGTTTLTLQLHDNGYESS
jgi:hypothetical protein